MNKKVLLGCICFIGILGFRALFYFQHTPKISVVMSTYNRADYLPKAIDSIENQTFQDWELIVINDGSSDNTANILKEYAAKDKRIKVLTNEKNKGLVYSLNRGLNKAKGEFIARMDDDDISLPHRLEKQYVYMLDNPDITATSSFVGQPLNGKPWPFQQKIKSDDMKVDLFLGTVPMSHPSIFVRNDFLKKNHIRYNEKYKAAEDNKFYLDLYDAGAVIGKIPEVLVLYRLHNENPTEWYAEQYKNTNLFLQNEIFPRFGIQAQIVVRPPCEQFLQMIEINKKNPQLPQNLLELSVRTRCPQNLVHHNLWHDHFVFNDNRVCRFSVPDDCGTILSKTEDSFTMKWDRWGIETFSQKDGIWQLKAPEQTDNVKKKLPPTPKKAPKKTKSSSK